MFWIWLMAGFLAAVTLAAGVAYWLLPSASESERDAANGLAIGEN